MMLIEQTTVPAAALPVEKFKEHLRMGSGFSDDALQDSILETCLRSAMAAIEARTGKVLIEREFLWQLTGWRALSEQALPVAPVGAVSSLKTLDRLSSATEIDAARFVLQRDAHRPKLLPTGACLPTIPLGGTAEVVFTAGFGADWNDIPADLAQAVMLVAAQFYEHRGDMRARGDTLPVGVNSLIAPYRTVRILGGAA
ncbi:MULTISPECIES: head-tail connector protein [Halocynthiibacter]|uniref:Phage gp6-like head-tail connector protein n=1 Tax=Halocynthiibacter halioticoli TaxID=2986804 RepID=A0AAE3J2J4_9RHOB|nr:MULTISPECIES: hypothetical protein [Halocynthiibacter]MCV6824087.1 hypothetical protein [Halocynthiibacter halioticoli]MCW4057088.1 hypothetical protein [Halocynthiibacter sp. SDUM655004]